MNHEYAEEWTSTSEDEVEILIEDESAEEREGSAPPARGGEVIVVIPEGVEVVVDRRADDGALCIRIAVEVLG